VSLAGISVIFGLEGVFSYPSLDILAIIGRKFEDQWLQFRVWTPILILPIVLTTDASSYAVSGFLSHKFSGGLKPIAFHCVSLNLYF